MAAIFRGELTCYILDSENYVIGQIAEMVDDTEGLRLVGSSTTPLEALPLFQGAGAPDLVFVGMYMNGMHGLDFAQAVKTLTRIVFTTALPWKVKETFQDDPFEYLPKPFGDVAFLKCIQRVSS
ncbi:LytR/AlgR family response regulator transcription factor [Mucilaginibacter terrae]|uniref:Two-component SAPR family response regulator n=1 Tax=Mucilaginibacter terrae TaxID=1955052 RepID=A0ABU3GN66_9SPHI|nr:hypothetical protein [Mucilaginibacter terrae]MDT3401223.1 two-component SAPR family response regulator [Mucilaginibacter terrae]